MAAALATTAAAQTGRGQPHDPAAVQRLAAETSGTLAVHDATGTVRWTRAQEAPAAAGTLEAARRATVQEKHAKAAAFLRRHARAFGVSDVDRDLVLIDATTDAQGHSHLAYAQRHAGLHVFGSRLRVHFDPGDSLTVVNGVLVPDIDVVTTPSRSLDEARRTAFTWVRLQSSEAGLAVRNWRLLVFREGLAKGVPGDNHLAYEVEIGNDTSVREFVYVDAHTGKVIDQITGVMDGLFRRAYDGLGLPNVPPTYPGTPFWVEGDPLPTSSSEADNMILSSKDTYDLFWNAFGRDSFDGAGAIMDAIFNRGYGCPNASWNGVFISFCPGLTTDDVTAHEWGHAYTQYTHDLIYQWQPGALNESYSDIFGEVVDRINGRGGDTPDASRTAGACSAFTTLAPTVTINAPPSIAGVKPAGTAAFGPQTFTLTNDVVLAQDGVGTTGDGCCAGPSFVCAPNSWPNAAAVAGKIVLVDRGTCGFVVKARNAQDQGAVGVLVANNTAGIINMAGADPTVVVPSLSVLQSDGTAIKGALVSGTVNATLSRGAVGTDNSVRWLMGEDATAPGLTGALRDMWTPSCYGDPARVTDTQYFCGTGDSGGVHTNSGVPNHAFSLLVDGGAYNGHTVNAIGLTKAAHIYFRAMKIYQGPASTFPDHADALEQSCADLTGTNLADLATGAPSNQVITAADCAAIATAMLAVEMRTSPTQCGFQPLLAKNPPPLCSPGQTMVQHFADSFDHGRSSQHRWSTTHVAVTADFTPRDWEVVLDLPDDRPGQAFFAVDPVIGTCTRGGDESGVLHLVSPRITIPASAPSPMLTFDHWVATESGWDGGNLKISVNDGPWQLVQRADFVYNAYNTTLFTAAQGNTNPMAGEPAFSGTDGGAVDGTWGRSIVNLGAYAGPNDTIRLRLDFGTDGCNGQFGWYVDDVKVYTCR